MQRMTYHLVRSPEVEGIAPYKYRNGLLKARGSKSGESGGVGRLGRRHAIGKDLDSERSGVQVATIVMRL